MLPAGVERVTDLKAIDPGAGAIAMKKLILVLATLTVAAIPPTPVTAQDISEWGVWDGPRRPSAATCRQAAV